MPSGSHHKVLQCADRRWRTRRSAIRTRGGQRDVQRDRQTYSRLAVYKVGEQLRGAGCTTCRLVVAIYCSAAAGFARPCRK
jgi:hypothetical protein